MSYYGVHSAQVDYMICITCRHEVFAWMAEEFACPTCGSSEYVSPECDGAADEDDAPEKITDQASINGPEKIAKKRKRTASDEGKMRS